MSYLGRKYRTCLNSLGQVMNFANSLTSIQLALLLQITHLAFNVLGFVSLNRKRRKKIKQMANMIIALITIWCLLYSGIDIIC